MKKLLLLFISLMFFNSCNVGIGWDWENLTVIALTVLAIGIFINVLAFLFAGILWLFGMGSKKSKDNQNKEQNFKKGWVDEEVYKVVKKGSAHTLFTLSGERVGTLGISKKTRVSAYNDRKYIQAYINKNGKKIFRKTTKKVI